ncbi:MAG TPA: hypothetical protein VFZ69_13100 [Longimicrobiales bacterium]
MRILWAVLGATLALPAVMAAQPPGRGMQRDRLLLERQVMERFARQVGDEMNLSASDRTRVRDWLVQSNQRRREMARETMALRRRMAEAVQSPATTDAEFERLLDELRTIRRRELEQLQSDERELSQWLTPRQRAQLFIGLGRFQERIRAIMAERGPGPPR